LAANERNEIKLNLHLIILTRRFVARKIVRESDRDSRRGGEGKDISQEGA